MKTELPKITDLTDEEINVRIAEAVGWTLVSGHSRAAEGPSSRFDQAEAHRMGSMASRAVSAQMRAKCADSGNGGAE